MNCLVFLTLKIKEPKPFVLESDWLDQMENSKVIIAKCPIERNEMQMEIEACDTK